MPPPQGESFLIVAFMARESMPPPDNTTDSTAASPTVICHTHSFSPDNTAPPPNASQLRSVVRRTEAAKYPNNTPPKESALGHHVDQHYRNTSEGPADEGRRSTDSPLGLRETEEEADVFHSEGADERPADSDYLPLLWSSMICRRQRQR